MDTERGNERDTDRQRPCERRSRAGSSELAQPVDDRGESGRKKQKTDGVESRLELGSRGWELPHSCDDRDDADWHVHIEDPPPRYRGDEKPADHGAEDRCEKHGDAEHAHHAADPLWTGGLSHDRRPDRHDHPATDSLDDPEGDERLPRTRRHPERIDPTRKTTSERIHIRLAPNLSTAHPDSGITMERASR